MTVFEREDDRLIFYPNIENSIGLSVILGLCILMILPALLIEGVINWVGMVIIICGLLIMSWILYISWGRTQIIIDPVRKKVIKKNILFSKDLLSLYNVKHIASYSTPQLFRSARAFELVPFDDANRPKIILTPPINIKSSKIKILEESIIPDLINILINNECRRYIPKPNPQIELFKIDDSGYYTYHKSRLYSSIILGLTILFWGILFMISSNHICLLFFILFSYALVVTGYKSAIDPKSGCIITSYWGLFKKTYDFGDNIDIKIDKNFTNNKLTSTNIRIIRNRKPYQILICNEKDSKKVLILVNELNVLLGRIKPNQVYAGKIYQINNEYHRHHLLP